MPGMETGCAHSLALILRRAEIASDLPGGEGFLDEFPYLLVAERLHALLHVDRPVGSVLIHLFEAGGDLRVAPGKSFYEFFPARGQSLGFLAGGTFPAGGFHLAGEGGPFLGTGVPVIRRPELVSLFGFVFV